MRAQASSRRLDLLAVAILAGLAVLGLWLFRSAVGLPYITDDISLLHEIARLRSGEIGWSEYFSIPHNEHRIPMLRLLYLTTAVSGMDALPLRLAVLGVHVACAWLLVRLTRQLWSTGAAVAVGVIAVSAAGFSSMPVWAPSTVIFSLSLVLVLTACELLLGSSRYRLPMATVAIVLACLSLNAAVLCLPVLVLTFWTRVGGPPRRRVIWAGSWIAIGIVIFLWSSANFLAVAPAGSGRIGAAVGNGAFLVVTAPYRWLLAWSTGGPGDVPGWLPAIAAFCAWGAAHFAVPARLRVLVLTLSASASLIAAAVAYGRSDFSWPMLYGTDRYYYWFIAPFSVVTVAGASALVRGRGGPRVFVVVAVLAAVSGRAQAQRTVDPILEYPWIRSSVTAIETVRRLGAALAESARAFPLAVRDSFVAIDGLHGDGLTLRSLSYAIEPRGISGLIVVPISTPASDVRLNEVLDRWAEREGWPAPPLQARDGVLIPRLSSRIDFQRWGFTHQMGAGFYAWDGRSRWMDTHGTVDLSRVDGAPLRIVARAPVSVLKQANPETSYTVAVSVDGVRVGVMDFGAGDLIDATFPVPDSGVEPVRVALDSAFSWKPKQIYPRNEDPRRLSISVELIALDAVSPSAGHR